jgi:iron-sulfur cluster assembly protein
MTDNTTLVSLTENAAKQISIIMKKQGFDKFLRISVQGGGCSGFQYKYDFSDIADKDDLIVEKNGAKVLIDIISLEFLTGATIDFTDELIGSSFKINNPNATAGCGCGTSFSV